MSKSLLIVESPTKAKTLQKYIGKKFTVKASVGHIKDLPENSLGVDIKDNFQPEYKVIKGKAKIIQELKKAAQEATDIYLGPDPDREGEAIAWHIQDELKSTGKTFHRVLFNEFTPKAIAGALASPAALDIHKFESQQARRILDRLVGYQISPLLWKKVQKGLSAGRVQSVAVRIICEREREIQAFVPEEYWSITAGLEGKEPPSFEARLVAIDQKKIKINDQAQAENILKDLEGQAYRVTKVERKEKKRHPNPPFITSTMQQEAYRKLRFSAKKTMLLAQQLYEGIDLGEEGPVGLITYMRTDSTRLSAEAVTAIREAIKQTFGPEYLPARPNVYKSRKSAQEAHEAIRPADPSLTPEKVKGFLSKDHFFLYDLIWKRFTASQMSSAVMDQTMVDIEAGSYGFRATGSIMKFLGFMALYVEGLDENGEAGEVTLPKLAAGEALKFLSLTPKQHFTQPPPRFTEATLIKTLEESGIGRPSTYATILSHIQVRKYASLEKGCFRPTELGFLVTDLLVNHFPDILNVKFTARMEDELDKIEEAQANWADTLRHFYGPFKERLDQAESNMVSLKGQGLPTDVTCDKCGNPMVIKTGKSGPFLACSSYPACKNTKDFNRDRNGKIEIQKDEEKSYGTCEKCGRPMVQKRGRFGAFLACSGYPDCKNTRPLGTGIKCPEPDCSGEIIQKRTKKGRVFYGCSKYPKCQFATWEQPVAEECPRCKSSFLLLKTDKNGDKQIRCPQKECDYKEKRS
ncbi:MAG: type I DNA topoisomerase [Thermodesulfobacteriota bacterium]|nr:type I DNA topoisomerase [Thermodesulfobacteriota bacterium]